MIRVTRGGEKMMKSNAVNAMLFVPKTLESSKAETSKGNFSSDDSFMDILNKSFTARKESEKVNVRRMQLHRDLIKINKLERTTNKDSFDPKLKSVSKTLNSEANSAVEVPKAERKAKPEVEGIKNTSENTEEKREINSLEALVALLEELMARLDSKLEESVPAMVEGAWEDLSIVQSETVSPMEVLAALIAGNSEDLVALINKMAENQESPDIKVLAEEIQGFIEKLTNVQDGSALAETTVEVEKVEAASKDLFNQLKARCGQLIEKLNEKVSKLNETSTLAKEQAPELKMDPALTPEIAPEENVQEVSVKIEAETKREANDSKSDMLASSKEAEITNVKVATTENENIFDSFVVQNQQVPVENLNQPVNLEKMQLPLTEKPLAQTVTNQVMMKVKLMAGENKQEMEMHLKPDTLGKLSIKIIHERGEILAKITAENQQVKEILESNMQMLKDALEKSGLTVQNLSVSVGNGDEDGQDKGNDNQKGRAQSANLAGTINSSSLADADRIDLRRRIEKEYFKETSQINLTA